MQDAGSTNGTTVNGHAVPRQGHGPPTELSSGDDVRLGQVELTFLDSDALRLVRARGSSGDQLPVDVDRDLRAALVVLARAHLHRAAVLGAVDAVALSGVHHAPAVLGELAAVVGRGSPRSCRRSRTSRTRRARAWSSRSRRSAPGIDRDVARDSPRESRPRSRPPGCAFVGRAGRRCRRARGSGAVRRGLARSRARLGVAAGSGTPGSSPHTPPRSSPARSRTRAGRLARVEIGSIGPRIAVA